jgi:tetratricopeptide (TPR) repeat protein
MIERGDVEEGLSRMRQIAEDKQDFMSWADLGAECTALKQYEEAKSCYQTALSLAESNETAAIANAGLFHVAKETDHVQDALSAWNMISVLNPDLGDQVAEVYTWLIERGDLEQAVKYLSREPDPMQKTFYQGMLDRRAGRDEAATANWRRVLDIEIADDSDATPWMRAAMLLEEPQTAIEAEDVLRDRNSPPSVEEAVTLGIAYAMLGEIDKAKTWFEQVIRRLERGWPVKTKIDSAQWSFLTSVITNQETVQALADFFEV